MIRDGLKKIVSLPDRIAGYYKNFPDFAATPEDIIGNRRTLALFRYLSWLITSLYFLNSNHTLPLPLKAGIILALLLASWLVVRLYSRNREKPKLTIGIVSIDVLFIAIVILPTGGLESPFVWYAINPVFMAISLLPAAYYMAVIGAIVAIFSGSALFQGYSISLTEWMNDPWFALEYLLLLTAAMLFMRLNKRLSLAYEKLARVHHSTERVLEYIIDLHQAMEAFSIGEDPRQLAALLATYAGKLTGAPAGYCYLLQGQYKFWWEKWDPDRLLNYIDASEAEMIWQQIRGQHSLEYRYPAEKYNLVSKELICIPISSTSSSYGLLGMVVNEGQQLNVNENRAVHYLAELVAIVLERLKTEDLASSLLVSEEQNRIANEIHDTVSQRLFSIVYSLHALAQKKQASLQDDEIQRQLALIKNTASTAAQELRSSIYRISPDKRGEHVFISSIKSYLESLGELNNITIDLQAEGSEETLSPALRKALYRIVREATSNAVRHGLCSSISVIIKMEPGKVLLIVKDDGQGFAMNKIKNGLGLANMKNLMASFNGRCTIESELGTGTTVTCTVPDEEHKQQIIS